MIEIDYLSATGTPAVLDWSQAMVHASTSLSAGPGEYRLRYHVKQLPDADGDSRGRSLLMASALLQIWPGSHRGLETVKLTSAFGVFWHPLETKASRTR